MQFKANKLNKRDLVRNSHNFYSLVNTGAYSTLSVSIYAQSLPSQVASCTKEERASVVPGFGVSPRSFSFPGV